MHGIDKNNLPNHVVLDVKSGREVYVYESDWEKCDNDIDYYFRVYDEPENLAHIRERAEIDEVIEFANKLREAGGGEVINELMLSKPQDSDSCLIANALNFSSFVNDDYGVWAMHPQDSFITEKICDSTGLPKVFGGDYDNELVGVELPHKIALVAMAFDTYRDVELEKYDALRQDNTTNPLAA
jgi:hypothetical protein